MTPVLARPRPAPSRDAGGVLAAVVVAVATAALMVPVSAALRGPAFVERVTVVNPLVHDVEVDARGAGGGWLGLGPVSRQEERTTREVADQGSRWVFRFSSAGVEGAELSVGRAELEAAGWRVVVPARAGERFRAAGLGPSPGPGYH